MSSTMYAKQNPSPVVTRRAPMSTEGTGNSAQRSTNRRSLSARLRNLFRRNSSSPNRSPSNDTRPQTTSVRQTSSSPVSGKSSTEAPHLQAPSVNWPFGKKKQKLSTTASTPKASKKKIKASQKKNQASTPPMVISSPIYQPENQTSIQGQYFIPRTPELIHGSTGRPQPSSNYEVTTTKGFRDYVVIDQTQQVVEPSVDVFTPSTYISDHSRSSSMNRQPLPNTNIEHHYYHDNSASPVSIPFADIEVIPTPQRKRKVGDTPPLTNTKILAEKPPIFPQTSSRPPSTIQPSNLTTNPTQWKNTSSSTLNNAGTHSTTSPPMDVDTPKLHAPLISFGGASKKKKPKRTKSQSRVDKVTSSSSTISNLAQQNPTNPNQSWTKTYGSLPDAEIIHGGSLTSIQPLKSSTKKYPGLSAIVQHHLRPAPSTYYNERPTTTTTTTTTTVSPQRPRRFDTSTTTLNEYEQNQSWLPHPISDGSPSSTSIHRHDGYIRPMTPQQPSVQPDVTVIRVDADDFQRRSPPPRPSRYDSPVPPAIYRSSATIYTQDKHRYVNGGEIRTWSSHENGINEDHNDLYQKPPYIHIQVNYKHEQQTNNYDQQVVPPKIKDNFDEYRYSPRAHEQELYEKEQKIINDQEIHEEERYEVSYEYEQQHQQYSYDTRAHYDELHATNRYSSDISDDQNLTYSKLSSARSAIINEREKIYDQSSRSYTDSERKQESLATVSPVNNSKEIPRTYALKRTDSYDGLGIAIAASSESSSNHFIREVEISSPGYRAGLRKNDRIISVNGINVENVDFTNVLILIKQGLDNDNLQLSVIHQPETN